MPATVHGLPSKLPAASPAFVRAARSIWRGTLAVYRALAHRSEVKHLLELNERELQDIGLSRNDVVGALSQPWGRDPSTILMVRSVERRSRVRRVADPRRVEGARVTAGLCPQD
jgi:uncharacterized protein YjiS (DUF1127 family)